MFSKLNANQDYRQIEKDANDVEKTEFGTHHGF